jgi:MFE-2 hydratase 2 N-terminal domain
MAIVYDRLMALDIPPREQSYDAKDCILYALGVGLGHDPMNEDELAFVYEKNLKVLPTMGTVLGHPGFWARNFDTGIDWVKVVNGEQGITLHRPIAGAGAVIGRQHIVEVVDKGAGKGALVLSERKIIDKATGEPIATVTHTMFCRGDGGFGGPPREAPAPHELPARAPDAVCDLGTRPEAALIYRKLRHCCACCSENLLRVRSEQDRGVRRAVFRAGLSGGDLAHRNVARRRSRELSHPCGGARRHRRQ